ncbi:hypothetical protein ERJ75_001000300 [Trypanosoma vivax]|uniref:Uncharacterized protein n=1 Tax=Trypanosoma vivax (strain Y486) TaxID=1055687 RepID=G0UAW0_TRYVY|nr:hypothetical protein TRVL_00972 [Trypanosoma vivax]KAH8611768.1 hypothetical protein ERJ75_001000300 [Trypanosoma vivax]CCC52947.1 conserved hypothetical protein [Trypanosoma vivax Y486]
MQQSEFNGVEAELREIERDFTSGDANVFGTQEIREGFVRDLGRIADIETQIFYKSCSLLSVGTAEDHKIRSMMYTSADSSHDAGDGGANNRSESNCPHQFSARRGRAEKGGAVNDADRSILSPPDSDMGASTRFSDVPFSRRRMSDISLGDFDDSARQQQQQSHQSTQQNPSHGSQQESLTFCSDNGFSERPFQNIARHFKLMESEFNAIGEHMRQMSTHVLGLNEIAERGRAAGIGYGP